jgi:hypothetical protein
MFRPSLFVAIFCLVASCHAAETVLLLNETAAAPILTNVLLTSNASSQVLADDASSNVTANGTGESTSLVASNIGRSLNVLQTPGSIHTATGSASSTGSIAIILVSLIVVAAIITIIIAALFVMRHRFNSWKLTGGNKSTGGDDAEGDCSNEKLTGGADGHNMAENEPATVVVSTENECALTSVENTQAMAQIESSSAAPVVSSANVAEVAKNIEEAVACSETPLLTTTTEVVTEPVTVVTPATEPATAVESIATPAVLTEQVTSSSSLIANVLSDLSESVVCKLASTNKSPVKSDDPEKQPLNEPESQ